MEAVRISFLLDKIRRTVVDQGQRTPPLDKIHTRIDRITEELEVMKAFLEGYNWSTIVAANEQLEAWSEQVKAVALKVEDIIDKYLYLVGEQRERTWKDYLSRPKNLCCHLAKVWHGIDSQLEATEKEILNLFDMRVRFGLRLSGNEDRIDSKKADKHHYQVYSPMLIDEDDLVGIEENTNKLLPWLTDADTCREMRTIAVWGKGGQGKTTLIANVYCNDTVKSHFDCQVWITISQNYSVEEILRRMILKISKRKTESILNGMITSMPLSKLLTAIQDNLQRKRCIIVLDDVWDENLWKQIQNAFVDSNNGSRLLITTRKHEVAKIASQRHIIELQQLNKVAKIARQQYIVELQQLDEVAKIASQQHIPELQQLDVANIASQQYIVELQQLNQIPKIAQQLNEVTKIAQQLNEIVKIASQQNNVELQQLDEVEKIASQHHTVELQQLDDVAKIPSQQYIVELQQLTKIAQQLNEVTKIAQQLDEIVKIASQRHTVELQQFNVAAKIASQQHIAALQKLNEVISQQHITALQKLNEVISQQHIAALQKLNEVIRQQHIAALQKLNEVISQQHIAALQKLNKVISQQHITALQKHNEVISQQHIAVLQKLNEVAKIASKQHTIELQQLIEVAKIESEQHIVMLQQLDEAAKIAKVEHIIELQLNEKDAWILFCKKAFRRENTIDCPQDLEDYARSILKKCQGSPLAISVIGGLLSTKEKSKTEWKKVHNRFDQEFGKNSLHDEVRSIINFCFYDLPYYLKDCFVYFSIFPEDYLIKRKKLIRLWVAEGFVEAKSSNRVMEEKADDYLAELVYRSMLQVVKRDEIGRPKALRMHAVVREVTLELSRKANFCMILNSSQSVLDNSTTSRLSIQTKDESIDLKKSLSRLRTLVTFSASNFSPHSLRAALISFEMLTVLELEDSPISKLPNEVSTLFSLHYLGLRWTKVKQLPNDIQKLQSLQTFDLRDSRVKKLPHGVTQLKQLRHLFVSGTEVEFGGIVAGCVPTLEGAWQWKNLQTLRSIKATKKLVQQLGDMKELRSLEVVEVKQAHCPHLYTSVTKMTKLHRLCLSTRGGEQLDFEMLNSPPPSPLPLQKLDLSGRLFRGKMPAIICSCAELVRVRLLWSQLTCDPLPSLGQLDKLVVFVLGPRAYDGQKLHFRTGWFLNLKRLYLGGLKHLNSIEIEKGAMASLRELVMAALPELKMVRHINFLTGLQTLSLSGMPEELVEKLSEHVTKKADKE